jgi:hypothetical protein
MTGFRDFPLKSPAGAVIWQMAWVFVLGFGLFLHYNPAHSLAAGAWQGLSAPMLVLAGLMLGAGSLRVAWLAWRITPFVISPRRTTP